jgi:hypothetical protein
MTKSAYIAAALFFFIMGSWFVYIAVLIGMKRDPDAWFPAIGGLFGIAAGIAIGIAGFKKSKPN